MYRLHQLSASVFEIKQGRARIGRVVKAATDFYARTDSNREARGATAQEAFRNLVTILNRVALCGSNDHAKAVQALEERNRRVEEENRKAWEAAAPVREAIAEVAAIFGRTIPTSCPRTRSRRIAI